MTPTIIETKNLSKYYGKTCGIEDLNLQIKTGEVFGFLGPNGAGKTTTIRLILNLLRPTFGHVLVFGKRVETHYYRIFKNIGVIPGELKLYEELTGLYFLEYMNNLSSGAPVLRNELLEAFQLKPEHLRKKIKQYSHGMKQKLAIIQAFQANPDLIIMDEPSEGLDPLNKNILYQYVRRFKEKGKTIFFSSHYLAEVDKVCDRVGLVKDGRLIAEEQIGQLKKKMVRRMEIKFSTEIDTTVFDLPDVQIKSKTGNEIILNVSGDLNPLIDILAGLEIENMIFPEPSLEETFLTYYEEPIFTGPVSEKNSP